LILGRSIRGIEKIRKTIILGLKIVDFKTDLDEIPDKIHFLEDKKIQENALKVYIPINRVNLCIYLIVPTLKPLFWQKIIVY